MESLGLGGHIGKTDAPNYIINCLKREVMDEEINISGNISKPKLLGSIYQPDKEVDKVHFGLIYASHVIGEVTYKESSITAGQMMPIDSIIHDPQIDQKYETWSKLLIPHLNELYDLSKPN